MIFPGIRRGKFQKAPLQESAGGLRNPGRGWYRIYPFSAGQEIDFAELRWCLDEEDTLALVMIDIGSCRESALSSEELDQIDRIFGFFAEHRKQMILRVTYDREGKGIQREPSFLSMVQTHMGQIGPLLCRYADQILVFQGLFVGSWGEMHHSRFLSEKQLCALYGTMKDAVQDRCFIGVRRPVQLRMLCRKEEMQDKKLALFNDGMFASQTHLGTYGEGKSQGSWKAPWGAEAEFAFQERFLCRSPNGGEAIGEAPVPFGETVRALGQMHVCYLNKTYGEERIREWKETPCAAKAPYSQLSVYEYIGLHLGYRFVVEDVHVTWMKKDRRQDAGACQIQILIRNRGFGNFCKKAQLWLIVRRSGETRRYPVPADPDKWDSGTVVTVMRELTEPELFGRQTKENKEGAAISLMLTQSCDRQVIFFANENAGEEVPLGIIFPQ